MFSSPKPGLNGGAATFISCGGGCRAGARRPREGRQAVQAMSMLLAIAPFLALAPGRAGAQPISGVVTSSKGPEAGVWVIAETEDLPTKFARIVVTDDQGRYLVPICPRPIIRCSCGAMGCSIRLGKPRSQDSSSMSESGSRRTPDRLRRFIRRRGGYRCSRCRTTRGSSASSRWT